MTTDIRIGLGGGRYYVQLLSMRYSPAYSLPSCIDEVPVSLVMIVSDSHGFYIFDHYREIFAKVSAVCAKVIKVEEFSQARPSIPTNPLHLSERAFPSNFF